MSRIEQSSFNLEIETILLLHVTILQYYSKLRGCGWHKTLDVGMNVAMIDPY